MSTNSVALDTLTFGGLIFPPCGTSERFSITFPASYTVTETFSDPVQNENPSTAATLTISCLTTDAAHLLMRQFAAQQQADNANPAARVAKPGRASLLAGADAATWQDCRITQQPNLTSAQEVALVTWVLSLSGARRVFPAAT
jgi:hypothetical protein